MRFARCLAPILLAATACGGGGGGGGFEASDLGKAIVQELEGPPGAIYQAQQSGSLNLDAFASKPEEKAELATNGFKGAHRSVFIGTGLTEGKESARAILSYAIALRDEAAAKAQFIWYRDTYLPKAGEGHRALADPKLGDESYGAAYTALEPSPHPTAAFLWRKGNAILFSLASGKADGESQALGFARIMDGRL